MAGTWLVHGWYTWLVHGWYTWLVHGWYMAGTWLVHGWYMAGTWLVHGWYTWLCSRPSGDASVTLRYRLNCDIRSPLQSQPLPPGQCNGHETEMVEASHAVSMTSIRDSRLVSWGNGDCRCVRGRGMHLWGQGAWYAPLGSGSVVCTPGVRGRGMHPWGQGARYAPLGSGGVVHVVVYCVHIYGHRWIYP